MYSLKTLHQNLNKENICLLDYILNILKSHKFISDVEPIFLHHGVYSLRNFSVP